MRVGVDVSGRDIQLTCDKVSDIELQLARDCAMVVFNTDKYPARQ